MKFLLFFFCFKIFSESVDTNLTDKKQIEIFHEVTSKIRCICLPSLPIKSCSFNNCAPSALLKQFIESRIKNGENAEQIIFGLEKGYGDKASGDPVLKKLIETNTTLANGVIYGFGEKILAEPNSILINLTLIISAIIGAFLIYFYFKKNSFSNKTISEPKKNTNLKKFMDEMEK